MGGEALAADCDHQKWATATWRETTYIPSLKQVEIFGSNPHPNSFECLGSTECKAGAQVLLMDCGEEDLPGAGVAFQWDDDQQRLISGVCPDLCIGITNLSAGAPLALQSCDDSSTKLSRIALF